MIKKFLLLLGLCVFWSSAYAAQVSITPQFADPRFEPADKLHAGCLNSANIDITTENNEEISSFRFIISYSPEHISILDVKPTEAYKDILDSRIEYDKIIVSVLNTTLPKNNKTPIFTISFKSNEEAKESTLAIRKPSYLIDKSGKEKSVFVEQALSFEKVSECEPDILPPTIVLKKPNTTSSLLWLDSYFVFEIKDLGKWINKESLSISFDGVLYTGNSESFVRTTGDYLSFYPEKWLPINKELHLDISISDKQIYGWANNLKRTFTFFTHSWIVFENNITPLMFRNLVGKTKYIYATDDECSALTFISTQSTALHFPLSSIQSLSKKINCSFDKTAVLQALQKNKSETKSTVFISTFSVLGWLLFGITFILKLNYFISYKKYKKIAKSLKSS